MHDFSTLQYELNVNKKPPEIPMVSFDMNVLSESYSPPQVAAQDGVAVPLPAPVALVFSV